MTCRSPWTNRIAIIRQFSIWRFPGRQQYHFRVVWKGNTVTEVQPAPDNARSGYSRVEKRDVRLFYGEDTPGRLYQRRTDLEPDNKPAPSPTSLDLQRIDWYCLR